MIGIGLFGCGRIAQGRMFDVLNNEISGATVVSVCDKVDHLAETAGRTLGAEATTESHEFFQSTNLDLVYIATESGNHFRHTMEALEHGKHVIVEKPPALFPDEVERISEFSEKNGLMYAVVLQNRLNPAMAILKKASEEKRFGKKVLSTIRLRWCREQAYYEDEWHGTWAMDGGVINQQAYHHVDALQWICGPVEDVVSAQANALNQLEAEDTTVAVARFWDGSLGVIEATTAARPQDFEASISIVGEKGIVVIGGIALNRIETWEFIDPLPEDASVPHQYSQKVPTGYGLSHGPLLQEVIDRLSVGNITPPISGRDAIPALRLVHALYRSTEIRNWVKVGDKSLSAHLGRQ